MIPQESDHRGAAGPIDLTFVDQLIIYLHHLLQPLFSVSAQWKTLALTHI
jgi:hypothetical protein